MSTDPTGETDPAASVAATHSAAESHAKAPEQAAAEPPAVAKSNRVVGLSLGAMVIIGFLAGMVGAALIAAADLLIGPRAEQEERLAAVESGLAAAPSAGAVEGVTKRAAALEQRAAALQGVLDTLGQRVEAARQASEQTKTALAQVKSAEPAAPRDEASAPAPDAAAINARLDDSSRHIGSVEQRLASTEQRLAALALAPKGPSSDEFARTVAALRDDIKAAGKPAPGSAELGIALTARDKLRLNAPLGKEIAALKALGAPDDLLIPLQPFADKAPPSMAALAQMLAAATPAIVAAQKPAGGGGWLDRLSAEAASLVRVRKLGDPAGRDPVDILARIGVELGQDRLAEALAAWNSLPEAARGASQDFAQQAQARLAAKQALDTLVVASIDKMVASATGAGVPSR